MKLDLLAFAAHPDDAELACSGTLYKHAQMGKKVGVIDLTQGELGSRGTPQTRAAETAESTAILGLHIRENLGLDDGFFTNNKENQLKVIAALRTYQPEIVLINAPTDRHPDHGKGAQLLKDACFYSGLIKITTVDKEGNSQKPWRPKRIFHYIQDMDLEPTLLIDITAAFETKMKSIQCFTTQFFDANSNDGPKTYISGQNFLNGIEARAALYGKRIGVKYAEGFIQAGSTMGLNSMFDMILPELT